VSTAASEQLEPFVSRWKRRAISIPVMLGAAALGVAGFPIVAAGAAVADIARLRFRFPTVRVAAFLVQYALNDTTEILLAPIFWVMAGFGTRLHAPTSVHRHERLQAWSIGVLARRAERLLGLRLELDDAGASALVPGPVVVLCRHVNIVDASLPALLYQRLGYRTRGVIMAELLADPGFDLIYGRTGSVFIPRDNGPEARSLVAQLGWGADACTALIIFPEGRIFRPDRRERSLARLAERDPDRARTLERTRHTIPPRPGGVLALLDALPDADVVVMAHSGLERYPTFRELARSVPLRHPVRVTAWRVAADQIPTGGNERTAWLDDQWCRVDAWVDAQASPA
jgi:1-acyl-sn-glycerol-3-phosphate acyltransferase